MSTALYRLLLRFYPSEIRRRWEQEMVETFALQLSDGWVDAWFHAVMELFQIALPRRATEKGVMIPLFSAAASGTLFFSLFWALGNSIRLLALYHHMLAKLGG